jgi:hypothetical protein
MMIASATNTLARSGTICARQTYHSEEEGDVGEKGRGNRMAVREALD